MDYLSKAKDIEKRALAPGFLRGEAARIKDLAPLRLIARFSKWLRGARFINAVLTAASTALLYIRSYAVMLMIAGASAILLSAFLLFTLPVSAAVYLAAGKRCRAEAERIKTEKRRVIFIFLSKKRALRPLLADTLRLFSDIGDIYVVTDSLSVGGNGGRRRIKDGICYVHRAFYHRLKRELVRSGAGCRVAVVI